LDTICGAIGMKAKPLPKPEGAGDFMVAAASVVRQALDAGSVVICPGEWAVDGPHGCVEWACWGILTEAREDGTILGACLNGFNDNPVSKTCYGGTAWALQPAPVSLSAEQVLPLLLSSALHRILGDAEPFVRTDRYSSGLDAMDVWIKKMLTVPFWSENPAASHSGAESTAWPTYAGARVASAFLRNHPSDPPVEEMLHELAEHYDNMRKLLHPALTGEGGESYKQFMNDKVKQEAHAEQVLRPVAVELDKAAQTIGTIVGELNQG
jgi:hypothetical protein